MKRQLCPDLQIDIFDPATMHELFAHPEPTAPLPPLPFARNQEVDVQRAARILDTDTKTVHRMCKEGLIRHYRVNDATPYRIMYESLVEYCDHLRLTYNIAPRRARSGGRIPDAEILPFPAAETISLTEVMQHLDVTSKASAIKLIDTGDLVAYKLQPAATSPWRIHRPSFVDYLHNLRQTAAATSAR